MLNLLEPFFAIGRLGPLTIKTLRTGKILEFGKITISRMYMYKLMAYVQ